MSGEIETLETLRDWIPRILDIFAPDLHNKIMKKKLERAIQMAQEIQETLKSYGLEIDYEKYFEEKLRIPLKAINAMSELETGSPRELLRSLFMRHITGKYQDDSRYVLFIKIIESMTPLDVSLLQAISNDNEIPVNAEKYAMSELREQLGCEYEEVLQSEESLLSLGLITMYQEIKVPETTREAQMSINGGEIGAKSRKSSLTWGKVLGEQSAIQKVRPKLTTLGRSFMEACRSPL